jgi:pimeloyl-ACP methyl ester carboxylesterase
MNYQKVIAGAFRSRQEPIPIFTDGEISRLTMPVIVFLGAKDIILNSGETADRLESLLPHARIVMLPGRGHSLSGLSDEIITYLAK